jgi:hypothetical protein
LGLNVAIFLELNVIAFDDDVLHAVVARRPEFAGHLDDVTVIHSDMPSMRSIREASSLFMRQRARLKSLVAFLGRQIER